MPFASADPVGPVAAGEEGVDGEQATSDAAAASAAAVTVRRRQIIAFPLRPAFQRTQAFYVKRSCRI